MLGAWAIGQIVTPSAAQAQCNNSNNPAPPPPVNQSFSNQSFANPPLTPYPLQPAGGQPAGGQPGCTGANGPSGTSGGNGSPGQPGPQVTVTNSNVTITGGYNPSGEPGASDAAQFASSGGTGGGGGQGGTATNATVQGGNGVVGGAGGPVTVTFSGALVPDRTTGIADSGLSVFSTGGGGGRGGDSSEGGIFEKVAGNGGPGAAGGAASFVGSGSVAAGDAVGVFSQGGSGGAGGFATTIDKLDDTQGGAGGPGGPGGSTSVTWQSGTITAEEQGLVAKSQGGPGGDGGASTSGPQNNGGNAGGGGSGGAASTLLSGGAIILTSPFASSDHVGITAQSQGSDGGAGGLPGAALGAGGGSGGNGGNGGPASATILGTSTLNGINQPGVFSGYGVLVQSSGGGGGPGAGVNVFVGSAGGGGFAGSGGSASLTLGNTALRGTIRASGTYGIGALVQSVGGSGGSGGNANFGGAGGAGTAGGAGGPVTVDAPNASVITTGQNGNALLAQSVGGGGGNGGDVTAITIGAQVAIGGNGGAGGNGSAVRVDLGNSVFASTNAFGGGGLLAQSIGGSGGNGGSASSTGVGAISLVVGGDAGGGGTGGKVTVNTGGLVTTYGDHAAGVQAQSIGGGGGKGGSALSFTADAGPTTSVSVGGRGGSGGPAGDVSVGNTGQVTTYGADAHGVLLQSIGGGGGGGGAAAARAVSLSPSKFVPAISISVATGGAGGAGNTGGSVELTNSGLVTTAGDGAIGVMAQSIGGGGGSGGDATAASYSNGPQGGVSISVSVGVGGTGGSGGTGRGVTLGNSGLIATLGQDAYGVFAQSVGGGGGTGGGGDATSSAGQAKYSFGASLAVGAKGGTGGDAGTVSLSNSGAITTRGDGADAVFAQSVGGGGGTAGGGVATAGGGNLSVVIGVGGSGGAGGNGTTGTVSNSGSIVTRGSDAIGVSVQSSGGGGKAGKGGATAGGVNPVSNATNLFNTLAAGLNFGQPVTNLGDGILKIGTEGKEIQATLDQLAGVFSQPQAGASQIGSSTKLNVAVSVGGTGGAAGNGGAVNAINTGNIATLGAQSDGIYAQSVGGGGGSAGAASSTDKAANDSTSQASVAVGGRSGGGGSGGPVTVTNGTGGMILTEGVAAFGVLAQSVGGGGGEGALAGTVNGSLSSLGVSLGGNGGRGGDGGTVTVSTGDRSTGSAVETTGKHGIGIFAQSVGGGGGLVRTMTTDQTFDPSKIVNNPQGRLGDVHGLSLTMGGQNGSGGSGGEVQVSLNGILRTSGLDAHGILAQSIGGGGGTAVGGQLSGNANGPSSNGGGGGEGGPVTVTLQNTGQIVTRGNGAHGILAQSIGGGGGVAGDLSAVNVYSSFASFPGINAAFLRSPGSGSSVTVGLNTASVLTAGNYAPGIFAQSIGGGGGLASFSIGDFGISNQLTHGTAGGSGTGGAVTISLANSGVTATGAGSAGILAQSDGTSRNAITVGIDKLSSVSGGTPDPSFPSGQAPNQRDAAAIRLLGGTINQISNAGTVTGLGGGFAILTDTPRGNTTVANTGTINGDVVFNAGVGNVVDNRVGGVLNAPTTVSLNGGVLHNAGTLHVGGIGTIGRTVVTGDLVQSATGVIVVDVAPGANAADRLQVNGAARLSGSVVPVVAAGTRLKPGAAQLNVLTATGGVVQDGLRVSLAGTPVVRYDLGTPDANTLNLGLTVDYAGAQALRAERLASSNRSEVGRALNTILAGDAGELGPLADRLAALPTAQALAATLDAFSGEAAASAQQVAFAAQQAFTATVLRHVTGGGGGAAPYQVASLNPVAGPPDNAHGMRVWVGGFGGNNVLNGSDGQGSLHTTTAGALIGLDKWFDADRMAGISVGGGATDFSIAGRASQGRGTSVNVSAYGLAQFGQAYVSGVLAYSNLSTDLKRNALGGATGLAASGRGSVANNVFGSRVEFGWRQPLGGAVVTPFASLAVDHLWQSGFTEDAAGDPGAGGLALRFHRSERTSVPLTLGSRVGSSFQLAGGRVLALSAELGWVHEFKPQRSVTAAFAAAPNAPFRVLGVSASRDAAQVGLDAKLSLTRNVALLGSFIGRFSGVETAIGGFGGLQVTW